MQPAKALDPILSSVLGKFSFFRLLFSSNELPKMYFTPSGIVISGNFKSAPLPAKLMDTVSVEILNSSASL